jgi:HEAT repeat protein
MATRFVTTASPSPTPGHTFPLVRCLAPWRFILLAIVISLTPGCGPKKPKLYRAPEPPAPPPREQVKLDPTLAESARNHLLSAARSSDELTRAHAIEGIKESMGSAGRNAIIEAFVDRAPLVRFAAAMAAGELRLTGTEPLLTKLVEDDNPHVQIGAIFALRRLGDKRYGLGIQEALNSGDPNVRANAAVALGRLGETTALKVLRPKLRDPVVEVRLQAAEAMWRLGSEDGLQYVVAGSLSRNPGHQMVALLALAGPRQERVADHIRPALTSDYTEVSLVAARALGQLGFDDGYAIAVKAAQSGEPRQRTLAALALGAIGRADAHETLATLIKDPDPDVRVAAASAILQLR